MSAKLYAAVLCALACACAPIASRAPMAPTAGLANAPPASAIAHTLRISTWNIAHLQADPDVGCHPRSVRTLRDMKRFVNEQLKADIAAIEEVRDEAAVRALFPSEDYDVFISSATPGFSPAPCGRSQFEPRDVARNLAPQIQQQRVAIVIRRNTPGLSSIRVVERSEFAIQHVGEDGVPRPVRPAMELTAMLDGAPISLLAVHLKSGCFEHAPESAPAAARPDCETLFRQAPLLQRWISEQEAAGRAYLIAGDFNRRHLIENNNAMTFWNAAFGEPDPYLPTSGLRQLQACRPQMDAYIDHFALGARTEQLYAPGSFSPQPVRDTFSDHCPISLSISSSPRYSASLGWVRNAAAYAALAREVYAQAIDALPRRIGARAVVVMDADETILDNSEYQEFLERRSATFSNPTFVRWSMKEAATAVPGALDYMKAVSERGGRIIVVTNRAGEDGVASVEHVEAATRKNIATLWATRFQQPMNNDFLCILGRSSREDDKDARRALVIAGSLSRCDAQTPLSPWTHSGGYRVAAYVGDQIGDFPCLDERSGTALRHSSDAASSCDSASGSSRLTDLFGEKYFLLPQPLYGNWANTDPTLRP